MGIIRKMAEEIEKPLEVQPNLEQPPVDYRREKIYNLLTVKDGKFSCYLFWICCEIFEIDNEKKLRQKSSTRINILEFPYKNYDIHQNTMTNYKSFLKSSNLILDPKGNSYALSDYFLRFLKEEFEFISHQAEIILKKLKERRENERR